MCTYSGTKSRFYMRILNTSTLLTPTSLMSSVEPIALIHDTMVRLFFLSRVPVLGRGVRSSIPGFSSLALYALAEAALTPVPMRPTCKGPGAVPVLWDPVAASLGSDLPTLRAPFVSPGSTLFARSRPSPPLRLRRKLLHLYDATL